MLKKLSIQNYAIIDAVSIDFSSRLNIITGETGAGKSILMGALSLILGERADSSVLVNAAKKCVIEGVFSVGTRKDIAGFLEKHTLDAEEELVLRREIAANGKSRAFINDTPVTLQQLKELASLLVDLHQQFDTLEIGDSGFQREVLDALGNNESVLDVYTLAYRKWQWARQLLTQLQQQKATFTKELDYNRFLFDELNELGLKENELENLDAELKLLSNAESIKTTLSKTYFDLRENEQPLVQTLKQLYTQLSSYAAFHPELAAVIERLQATQVELKDISDEIAHINDSVNYDAQRIEWINQRMMEGYKLTQKHGVQTTRELLAIQEELQNKLKAVLDMDEAIAAGEKETAACFTEADALAGKLAASRRKAAKPLEENVNRLLAQVGMPNARLKTEITETSLGEYGKDTVEFLFDANKSNRFEPVRKVASGGELSRLMLCIKSLVATSIDLPTMIFDEIDTGISGEAARQVGLIMKELAAARQLICITHQPQIAGKADAHFFVYKEAENDAIKTRIRLLTQEERILTIARMLSGENPTAAAMENAREMVENEKLKVKSEKSKVKSQKKGNNEL